MEQYDSMAQLIDKVRKANQQAAITGNQQQGAHVENTALTSFYDAAMGRRTQNRQIALQETSEANNQAYRNASLDFQRAQQEYIKDQNAKNEKFQWMGLGTTLLKEIGTGVAAYAGNQNAQRTLDEYKRRNDLLEKQITGNQGDTQFQYQYKPTIFTDQTKQPALSYGFKPYNFNEMDTNYQLPSQSNDALLSDSLRNSISFEQPVWMNFNWDALANNNQ